MAVFPPAILCFGIRWPAGGPRIRILVHRNAEKKSRRMAIISSLFVLQNPRPVIYRPRDREPQRAQ